MRQLLIALFLLTTFTASADPIEVPEGYVLQRLVETDGQIARPKDWFFTSKGRPSGWLWTFSQEDPDKGPYKTGLRIQLLIGVAEGTGQSRKAFVQNFIAEKRAAVTEVLSDCPRADVGKFYRKCLEVIEPISGDNYRILYSMMWGKELDMVVLTTFGTPKENWDKVAPISEVMSVFELIGPNLGKSESAQE